MNINEYITHKLPDILNIARLAPSVHNTQPWKVASADDSIMVSLDATHTLKYGDPTGRQTIISLGIFCEAIVIAAAYFNLKPTSIELQQSVGVIKLKEHDTDKTEVENLIKLLKARSSDRSIFNPIRIEKDFMSAIQNLQNSKGVRIQVITDRKILDQIAILTGKGIRLALSSPAFRNELKNYLVLPWSKKSRGISVSSLYIPWPLQILQPLILSLGNRTGAEGELEKKRWLSSSAVVAILGDGDLSKYWFEAGRTYLKTSLAIEGAGFSQATSAAIVEASNYHEDIESSLHTSQRILALIRIGKGSKKRFYSPRVLVTELLTSNQ